MQKVLSSDLWKTVKAQARKARLRKVAIPYVTQDLLGFRKGDLLLVDASPLAVSSGETDAKLLRDLLWKGVRLYHCESLHAKVMLLDDVAVISSGNMSKSSDKHLVEAGLITDQSSTVAGIASFIEQLIPQSRELLAGDIDSLCKIKVTRRGGRPQRGAKRRKPKVNPLGNQTWLIGVYELAEDPPPNEQELIDRAIESLRPKMKAQQEVCWVRFPHKHPFAMNCKEGDSLIQIWNSSTAKRPSSVFRVTPVLLKEKTERWTYFYSPEPTGRRTKMPWGKFQRLLKKVGHKRPVKAGSKQLLDPEIADAITRMWAAAAKS
jgi:hypothetical protein